MGSWLRRRKSPKTLLSHDDLFVLTQVVLASSRAVTKQPLALLVDGQSASASEILAGALRDNGHRAVLIGDHKTYGKGKVRALEASRLGSTV